jgi:hypothetical protein
MKNIASTGTVSVCKANTSAIKTHTEMVTAEATCLIMGVLHVILGEHYIYDQFINTVQTVLSTFTAGIQEQYQQLL